MPRKPKVKRTDWEAACKAAELGWTNCARQKAADRAELLAAQSTLASLTEQLKAKDARIALLEHDRSEMGKFMSDCQLVLATAPCTLCGAKWINAGGLQEAFKRYADRTAIPPKGTK